jgi:DNA-binding SARP family transcriptional activator
MLSVLLLGPPQVFRDGQSLAIPRRRSRALLYYLAAQTAPVSREHLLAFFWPDEHRYDAQHQLRTSLYALRCALGEALHTSDRQVALADDVRVDLRELEAAVGAPTARLDALDAALQHYRGDFLDSFALDDVPAFAQWLEAERTRWRRLACRGFTCLAELLAARGKHRAALAAVDRALTIDPLQEDVQCAGMRLAYLAGDRVDAIRRFEALRRLLDDELGVPPMDATHTLYDSIITDTLERPPPVSTVRRPAVCRSARRARRDSGGNAGPPAGVCGRCRRHW